MSFAPEFKSRLTAVIAPAVASVHYRGVPLTMHRVDETRLSDSIVAEIVEGIARDRLIFIDLTSIGTIAGKAVRNGNVMYELGLAHAMRQPEEVVIFRSDDDPLLFDVSGIRVQRYDPDGAPEEALKILSAALTDAIRFSALADQYSIDRTVGELDPLSIALLFGVGGYPLSPDLKDLKQASRNTRWIPAFHRLLGLQVLRTRLARVMSAADPKAASLDDLSNFELTDLGVEVMFQMLDSTGIWEAFGSKVPEIAAQHAEWRIRKGTAITDVRARPSPPQE